ncbi:hypothetical protein [Kitasatospora purpeofusca]|uniref:hypothetical protein n=1 Tax=Kitasatospora purpeofusca TaxID=67352 RepID=UPI0037FE15C8
MTRRHIPEDPTARTATTNALGLSDRAEELLTAMVGALSILDLSEAEVRRQFGMSRRELLREYSKQVVWVRHPVSTVPRELNDLADGLPPDLVTALRAIEQRMFSACEQCQRAAVPPQRKAGGRPQRYCSNACRQQAYRQRARDRLAD